MDTKDNVIKLIKKYNSSDPFEIAKYLGLTIIYEELGSVNGYYNKVKRHKQIHLNWNLDEHQIRFTVSHELGHAIMHPNANTPFLRASTYLSIDKMEIEANSFAMYLLISDADLLECREYSIEQLSRIFGYHERLIQLRF